jgi:Poly (ADP-ribose) glycohydrolase (PARG), Macro domain fold
MFAHITRSRLRGYASRVIHCTLSAPIIQQCIQRGRVNIEHTQFVASSSIMTQTHKHTHISSINTPLHAYTTCGVRQSSQQVSRRFASSSSSSSSSSNMQSEVREEKVIPGHTAWSNPRLPEGTLTMENEPGTSQSSMNVDLSYDSAKNAPPPLPESLSKLLQSGAQPNGFTNAEEAMQFLFQIREQSAKILGLECPSLTDMLSKGTMFEKGGTITVDIEADTDADDHSQQHHDVDIDAPDWVQNELVPALRNACTLALLPDSQKSKNMWDSISWKHLSLSQSGSVSIRRSTVAALIARSLLHLHAPVAKSFYTHQNLNFDLLSPFESEPSKKGNQIAKLRSLCRYLNRQASTVSELDNEYVVVHRRALSLGHLSGPLSFYSINNDHSTAAVPLVFLSKRDIGEAPVTQLASIIGPSLPSDGFLSGSASPSDAWIADHPECLATMFCLDRIDDHEAFTVTGAQRHSSLRRGQGRRFIWPYSDSASANNTETLPSRTVTHLDMNMSNDVFVSVEAVLREIIKSYTAFSMPASYIDDPNPDGRGSRTRAAEITAVASGIFNMDLDVRSIAYVDAMVIFVLLQWIAASLARRPLVMYCKHLPHSAGFHKLASLVASRNLSVSRLFAMLMDSCSILRNRPDEPVLLKYLEERAQMYGAQQHRQNKKAEKAQKRRQRNKR